MISLKIILDAIAGFIVLASVNGYAAQLQTGDEVVARKASEDPRGADNSNQGRRGRAK